MTKNFWKIVGLCLLGALIGQGLAEKNLGGTIGVATILLILELRKIHKALAARECSKDSEE